MKKETIKRAIEIEDDLYVISKLLLAKQNRQWVKISTPKYTELNLSSHFYDRLIKFVELYGVEISDEFEKL